MEPFRPSCLVLLHSGRPVAIMKEHTEKVPVGDDARTAEATNARTTCSSSCGSLHRDSRPYFGACQDGDRRSAVASTGACPTCEARPYPGELAVWIPPRRARFASVRGCGSVRIPAEWTRPTWGWPMMRYISLFLRSRLPAAPLGAVPSPCPTFRACRNRKKHPRFDSASNGVVDDTTHQADRTAFDAIEGSATAWALYTRSPAGNAIRTRIRRRQSGDRAARRPSDHKTLRQPERSDRGRHRDHHRPDAHQRQGHLPQRCFPDQESRSAFPRARPFVPCACRRSPRRWLRRSRARSTLLRIAAWQCRGRRAASAGRPSRCRY